jgi:hypothetical protein
MRTTQEIVDSIDTRLRELRKEIKTLDTARAALKAREAGSSRRAAREATQRDTAASGVSLRKLTSAKSDGQASAPAAGGQSRRSRRPPLKASRPKANRAGNAFPADRLESLLSGNGNGGLTTSELAAQASADRDRILGMLRELEAAGRVRRSGQRRATRWHVITDEDRIRERAAELEATRRRPA